MAKEYLTLKELSEKIKMSRSTIDKWRGEGLPFIKMGRSIRFDEDAVMEWIRKNKS
jgi:excisionase family DNA binding protein